MVRTFPLKDKAKLVHKLPCGSMKLSVIASQSKVWTGASR